MLNSAVSKRLDVNLQKCWKQTFKTNQSANLHIITLRFPSALEMNSANDHKLL